MPTLRWPRRRAGVIGFACTAAVVLWVLLKCIGLTLSPVDSSVVIAGVAAVVAALTWAASSDLPSESELDETESHHRSAISSLLVTSPADAERQSTISSENVSLIGNSTAALSEVPGPLPDSTCEPSRAPESRPRGWGAK